jgi:protein-disulfide isomerase
VLGWAAFGTLARADAVAILDKDQVTSQELDARTAEKLAAQREEYDRRATELRMAFERSQAAYRDRQLNKLIDEHVLALEARARHTTTPALLDAQHATPVSDADVRSFYDQRRADINQSFETAAPKIREFLEQSASEEVRHRYLDGLRKKYHVVIALEPRREPVAAEGPSRGPDDAVVAIVEFSDFQCPFCGRLEPVLVGVLAKYPRTVRLVYRNYPLPELHPQAEKAAEAGLCAKEQGKFWEMHDLLFAEQEALSAQDLKDKARRLGLDTKAFSTCIDSGKMSEAVQADVRAGEALGIQGTPGTFINGRFLSGAVDESELTAIIDDELERAHRVARR